MRPKPAERLEVLTESALSGSIEASPTPALELTSDIKNANLSSTNTSSALVMDVLDANRFRLLDLPFEVRQMIYEALLISNGNISLTQPTVPCHVTHYLKCYTCSLNLPRNLPLNHRIMYTCKKVYDEALPVFYRLNTFSVRAHDRSYRSCPLAWSDMQLHGAGLLHLRRLRLEAPMLQGILKGSVYSFWNQLLRKAPALEHVTLISVGGPYCTPGGETAIALAWNIAQCFPKNTPASVTESLSLFVNLSIETDYGSYYKIKEVVSRSRHSHMPMAEGLTIEAHGKLKGDELGVLEAYKMKGWAWRRISEDTGVDGHQVVLQWRKA